MLGRLVAAGYSWPGPFRRRRRASRSTSSSSSSPMPAGRSTTWRRGCSGRVMPRRWGTRRSSGRSRTAASRGGSRSPASLPLLGPILGSGGGGTRKHVFALCGCYVVVCALVMWTLCGCICPSAGRWRVVWSRGGRPSGGHIGAVWSLPWPGAGHARVRGGLAAAIAAPKINA